MDPGKMSKPTRQELNGLLGVVYRVIIEARILGWEGENGNIGIKPKECKYLADMMDAIHNIPLAINEEQHYDNDFLLLLLKGFDEKWANKENLSLMTTYNDYYMRK